MSHFLRCIIFAVLCVPSPTAESLLLCSAAELKYGTLMELSKQLKQAEDALVRKSGGNGAKLLKEEVTEADIAEIISKWTGEGGGRRGKERRFEVTCV